MTGDKARGDWTPWPVVDGQLEIVMPEGEDWPDPASYDFLNEPFGPPDYGPHRPHGTKG